MTERCLETRHSPDGLVVDIRLDRPEKLNALTPALMQELLETLQTIARSDARIVTVSGKGRAFCAGVDLAALQSPDYTPEVSQHFMETARQAIALLETMPQVTIAKVHGYCFTGGLELVLGCDLIVAAADAVFCDTHAKLGLQARWGMSQRLPRRVGGQQARLMTFTARRVLAPEAEAIGLILKHLPTDGLNDYLAALVAQILANSHDAVIAHKHLFTLADNLPLNEGIAAERDSKPPLRDRAKGIAGFAAPREG